MVSNRSSFYGLFLFLLLAGLLAAGGAVAGKAVLRKAAPVFAWPGSKTASDRKAVKVPSVQDPPEVTITADDKLPCPGQPVIFTAVVTNGGLNPVYQWQINGVNNGTNSSVFVVDEVTTKLNTMDAVRCIVTNTDNGLSATSNLVSSILIIQPPVARVSLLDNHYQINSQITICQGTPVIFWTSNNVGNSSLLDPTFHYDEYYQVNGADLPLMPIGTDLSPYVKNGDVVTVKLTYANKCFSGSAISNQTIVYITPSSPASVSIAADSAVSCAGLLVKFRASALNAGTSPVFQWLLNGQNAGSNDSTFTGSDLKTGDQLQCRVTSSNACAAGVAMSNTLQVTVLPVVNNTVSIHSTMTGKYITAGQRITFTAIVPDGTGVSYQWQLNSMNVGTNSSSFTSALLQLGDVVVCKVTKAGSCTVPLVATSNAITILILVPLVVPNTFTPNGDGINDTWDLRALLAYPGCLVQVFNRYGALVYQCTGYSAGWDGTTGGKPLPMGTYYYLIDLKNGKRPSSGSITIIR